MESVQRLNKRGGGGADLHNVVSLVTSLQETADELGEEVSVLSQQRFFQLLTHKRTHTEQQGAEVSHFYKVFTSTAFTKL